MLSRRCATAVVRANWWDSGRLEHLVRRFLPDVKVKRPPPYTSCWTFKCNQQEIELVKEIPHQTSNAIATTIGKDKREANRYIDSPNTIRAFNAEATNMGQNLAVPCRKETSVITGTRRTPQNICRSSRTGGDTKTMPKTCAKASNVFAARTASRRSMNGNSVAPSLTIAHSPKRLTPC